MSTTCVIEVVDSNDKPASRNTNVPTGNASLVNGSIQNRTMDRDDGTELCGNNGNKKLTMANKKKVINQTYTYFFGKYIIPFAQVCMLCFVILVLYLCLFNEFVFFTWHPLLMSLGWVTLMTQAILIITKQDFLTVNSTHKQRIQYHWILQSIGAVLSTVGFTIVVINKFNLNKTHFKTWHALFGLIGFVCCVVSCLSGALTLYNFQLRQYISPRVNKFLHIFSGVVTYGLGGFAAIISVYSNWFNKKSEQSDLLFMFGFLAVISIVVATLVKPTISLVRRSYKFFE